MNVKMWLIILILAAVILVAVGKVINPKEQREKYNKKKSK
ncbi:hypothetical protein CLL_A2876 [Clostridium botulinum B str. Eklund 17B (NRP)]|uniref:Uncharacterized protein n=1 Tax=Clostridium botulinum (strain Eklund 17B / Type B) TaxID=935198 RepID=B2TPA6_CLOBB|nr:hypothetical protein CLL_A2876 [Clostridium botulinum B str. Eklund 17B (NRP)]ACD52119.1 hypothetical protein CLH_2604 [Clostridium botulinum E3 str. Alaska E43]EES51239.1 hypothetical protein CLO_0774 [Clostridium botulinum E1 str. 'BoNT E Beluga']CDH91782.1 hypothetical protein CB17B2793 [Clostridium botulinum B str. Eklund 17B (NRP)]